MTGRCRSAAMVILAAAVSAGCTTRPLDTSPTPSTQPSGPAASPAFPSLSPSAIATPSAAAASPSGSPAVIAPLPPLSGAAGRDWLDPMALTTTGRYGSVNAVAAGPMGWLAVGWAVQWADDSSGGSHFQWRTARLWTSDDGGDWAPVPDDDRFADHELFGVNWTSQGFVAVGLWKDEQADPGGESGKTQVFGGGPAALRSPDGLAWSPIPVVADPADADIDGGRMNAVIDVRGRLVAVGCLDANCLFGPAVWVTEPDGGFRMATALPAAGPAAAYDVVQSGGQLVAVGVINAAGDAPQRAAVWRSVDGERWTPDAEVEAATEGVMRGVDRVGERLVAVGSTETPTGPRPAAWLSDDDGATWQAAGAGAFGPAIGSDLRAVAYTGAAVVAVGWIWGEPWRSTAWVSVDGVTWDRVEVPGTGAPANSIADGAGGLVAVGGFQGGVQSWRSPVTGP